MNQPDPQSRSFEKVMSGIELGTLKIPQFQREFVWPRGKVGQTDRQHPEGLSDWHVHPVEDEGATPLREGDRRTDASADPKGDYSEQILDGQQRLTSLYAACKGLTVTRDERPDHFRDIFVDLDADADDDAEAPIVAIAPQGDVASAEKDGHCVRLVDLLSGEFELLVKLDATRRQQLQTYQQPAPDLPVLGDPNPRCAD